MKVLLIFVIACVAIVYSQNSMAVQSEWKYIEFDWDSDEQRQNAIDSGKYNESAYVIPIDVDIDLKLKDNHTFVTLLRIPGVPATLTTVSDKMGDGGPLLRPYPDWETNLNEDCKGLTNVYRVAVDECNQLWIADAGMYDSSLGSVTGTPSCPAKLVVYSLYTDTIVKSREIPSSMYDGQLLNIVVHTISDDCKNSLAYIADKSGGIVIYDGGSDDFCRFEANEMKPDSMAEDFSINDDKVTLETGILGMALGPRDDDDPNDDQRALYFRPLSSFNINSLISGELRRYCSTKRKPEISTADYKLPSQSISLAMSDNYQLFFDYISKTNVNCADVYEGVKEKNIRPVATDPEQLQWTSGMKVSPPNGEWQTIYVLTNRYQKAYNCILDRDDVNFRIFQSNVYVLTYGVC